MHIFLEEGVIQQVPDGTPLCKDCKFFKELYNLTLCTSDSYNRIVDPIYGSDYTFKKNCMTCRSDGNINGCGPLGLKYQHKGK